MKKIIAILITLTMLFSTLSIMPAFAYQLVGQAATWTQDFENAISTDYPTAGGSTEMSIEAKNGSNCLKIVPTAAGTNTRGAKVFIDQTAFEVGKTYVIEMDAYLEGHTSDTMTFNVKWLKGTGNDASNVKVNTLRKDQPVKITTNALYMTDALLATTGGMNLRIDSNVWSYTSDTERTVVYIDNVKVIPQEKVSYFKDKIDEDGATFNFDDIADTTAWASEIDYTSNGTSCAITDAKNASGSGKSLYFVSGNSIFNSRLVLKDLFKNADIGKSFNVSLKIYVDTTTPDHIYIGTKASGNSNNAWSSDAKKYMIGNGEDILPNEWNTIEYVATVEAPLVGSENVLTDGIAFSYRTPAGKTADDASVFAPFYIDDIVITPVDDIDYFADAEGNKVATEFDAGYYAESADAAEKVGEVVVNSYISVDEKATAKYEKFGMYVYISADDKKDVFAGTEVIDSLVAAEGYINVLITEIAQANFDTSIVAVPYVVVDGETVLGDTFTFKVNDKTLKYLGVESSNSGEAPAEPEPATVE